MTDYIESVVTQGEIREIIFSESGGIIRYNPKVGY